MKMNKYVFEDLIINPETPGLRSLIGKEVYFSDVPLSCIKGANNNCEVGILKGICKGITFPFQIETSEKEVLNFACIIFKKEESKPEYAPFKSKEEFVEGYVEAKGGVKSNSFEDNLLQCGMWIKVKGMSSGGYCMVNELWNDGVALGHSKIYNVQNVSGEYSTVVETVSWEDLYKGFTFLDDSPCGKLAEIK